MSNAEVIDPVEGVAVVGMAGRFPGAATTREFWQNLCRGVESVTFFTEEELIDAGLDPAEVRRPDYVRARGVLEGIELFDAAFFGFTPREAEITDPQHRLFLECAWESLEDAGYDPSRYAGRIGLFAGVSMSSYFLNNLRTRPDLIELVGDRPVVLGNDRDYLATRVSYKLNLKGPSMIVQTACSTSLVAVHLACQSLLNFQSDMALAGGVSAAVPQKTGYVYQEGGITSPDGHCRAFDAGARGTIGGSGVGVVVLKRLEDALADGDEIYAVVKGSAINNDGSAKIGYTAPSVEGQAEVIAEAQALAGVAPEEISYVEAHGTGTTLGDPIEVAALNEVFGSAPERRNTCALGSVKTNVGHLDAAAGVTGVIKTALALKHKLIPPSLHFEAPNPQLDFNAGPFYVNTKLSEWETNGRPRVAGISSFGIGGTNAHAVLCEAPEDEEHANAPSKLFQLMLVSARTGTALEAACANLAAHLRELEEDALADVAYTLQVGRKEFAHRRAFVCEGRESAVAALEGREAARVFEGSQEASSSARRVMFMFPGQGAQHVRMAAGVYETEPTFRAHLDECAELLIPTLGFDLRDVLYPKHDAEEEECSRRLQQTALTQPALFAVEYAMAQLWMRCGVRPAAMIGHSVGEYVAACLAGVMTLKDALTLVAARGRLMQSLPAGTMLSVSLSERETQKHLDGQVSLAAVNGPAHCVVAGPTESIERLEQQLNAKGIDCRRLRTSHAFHSSMMEPILPAFAEEVRKVKLSAPRVAYVSNVTGKLATAEEVTRPEYWVEHLRRAVRFADGLKTLAGEAEGVFLEVGAGRTLTALARLGLDRDAGQLAVASLRGAGEEGHDRSHWLGALGQLWVAGVRVDWKGFYEGERRRRVHLPTYPFERRRYFVEARCDAEDASAARAKSAKRSDVGEWFYAPVWQQSLAAKVARSSEEESRWLLLCDECGLGEALAARLEAEGRRVVVVRRGARFERAGEGSYTIDAARREDYAALFSDLSGRKLLPQHIAHLWNVTTTNGAPRDVDEERVAAFDSLLYLGQALGERQATEQVRVGVVSNNAQDVLGVEELEPSKALLVGPCRVVGKEYPNLSCVGVDVVLPETEARREELIAQLVGELDAEPSEPVVALRGARRWVQRFEPVRLAEAAARPSRLRERGVYLITGGLGGVALAVADYLARAARARLVLVARTVLPARGEWDAWLGSHDDEDVTGQRIRKIRALEEAGAEVLVVKADVSDGASMKEALAEAKGRFGEVNGVVHAAGVAGGGLIQLQSVEAARAVLAPKVEGTRVLAELLGDAKLDFFVLFSSHVSLLGGLGRVEYAAANAFLDAFARSGQAKLSGHTVAVNWDTWREAGMAADELARLKLDPEQSIPEGIFNREGTDAFARVLESDLSQVVVSTRDFGWVIEQSAAQTAARELEEMETARRTQTRHPRPQLGNAYVAPRDETERRIADIWQDLLGIEGVGVEDNFFELGGDSVVSIQVIARANQAGLSLTPRQVFEHPTVAGLASVAGLGAGVVAEQGEVTGPVALTPIQRWFFEQELADPHHFNQSVMFAVRRTLDPALLAKSVAQLLAHHDALRLRFTRDAEGWHQFNAATNETSEAVEDAPFTFEDLSALPEAEQGAAVTARAAELQRGLCIERGPLARVALFHLGEGRPGRLFFVVHHLAVDGLSWRTLLEDLQTTYEQLARGEAVELPAKTTSFQRWAERLEEHAQGAELRDEASYWLGQLGAAGAARLPVDAAGGENTFASARTVAVALDNEETLALLQEVPKAFNTQINDVLLTALAQSFSTWTGSRRLLVDLEGHGREALFDDVDVSRTVGWFTSIFPVLLDLGEAASPGEELKRVKEGLRAVPGRGIGYGLLRYLCRDEEVAPQLAALPGAEVSFLYLGQLDQVVSEDSLFGGADEDTGPSRSPEARRGYLLEFTARVVGGQLRAEFTYSENLHDAATVERLAEDFAEALREIVQHCRAQETVGYTPSDFAEFGWTQEDLDNILDRINDSTGVS